MPDVDTMKCADCGIDMNHHADKIDYSTGPGGVDPELGGILFESHCCPECGKSATRIAR